MRLVERFRRWLRRADYSRHVMSQTIEMPNFSPSHFNYEVNWFGEHVKYEPGSEFSKAFENYRYLKFHTFPKFINKSYYFKLRDALILGNEVIDSDRPENLFFETYPFIFFPSRPKSWFVHSKKRVKIANSSKKNQRKFGKSFLFSCRQRNNFYHFIIDACARYEALRRVGAIDRETEILFSERPNSWQTELLELLDIDLKPQNVLEEGECVKVEELVIGSPVRHGYVCSAPAVRGLRARLLARAGLSGRSEVSGGRRIYVSRRDAASRRVLNEADVVAQLQESGFEIVTLSELSVREQMERFFDADLIVAPHGAGLTNMIFSEKARIVELLPGDGLDLGFFITLAATLGHEHFPLVSESASEGPDFMGKSLKNADFRVDLDALKGLLDGMAH